MNQRLKNILTEQFSFRPNKNQLKELECLIFEIMRREDISQKSILSCLSQNQTSKPCKGKTAFFHIKKALLQRRFPLASSQRSISPKEVFLPQIPLPLENNCSVKKIFLPETIYVEKRVSASDLAKNFKASFPGTAVEEIEYYSDYVKEHPLALGDLKKPLIFIIEEKWDFIKTCPCTPNHLNCGYWIFNLGFGCPFDCSYCFLQHYSNSPGIILPANIEDFFEVFDRFEKKLTRKIRIGTGEFCDSLALDHISQYSKKLIPYFSKKNVFFELKTKSANIDNILSTRACNNIIISWSLNPASLIDSEEAGASSLSERIDAAFAVQAAGYSIGFHFDPILYSQDWQILYAGLIDDLYARLKGPFAWISLGTLRCQRKLKYISQQRFPQSKIFYGELLLAEDKKLRYPEHLRKEMYKYLNDCIRRHDNKTPVYLCMENNVSWKVLDGNYNNRGSIENYILNY